MIHYDYLIVGGGMSAGAAMKSIREIDAEGSIGLVSDDTERPYRRPPLSKKLWQGKPLESIWKSMDADGVEMHLGRTVLTIDPKEKFVVDDEGTRYSYDKLLLATGGTPKRLPFGGDDVIYFRYLSDYRRLRALAEPGERFAVIGGGFIGSELASALAMNGKKVTMLVHGKGIGERVYPPDMVDFLNDYFRDKGVQVLRGDSATGIEKRDAALDLKLESGRVLSVDGVVAGIGIEPNTDLARAAGLRIDDENGGVFVDEFLRTSVPDIFAAGDVASYWDHTLGKRRRVEHEDNANSMGKAAGHSMANAAEPYLHLPFFYSDLFDLGYEAVGELDSRMETVADWKEPYREGVVYYLDGGKVRGVLLWNVWHQRDAARRLIAEDRTYKRDELIGRLPEEASN